MNGISTETTSSRNGAAMMVAIGAALMFTISYAGYPHATPRPDGIASANGPACRDAGLARLPEIRSTPFCTDAEGRILFVPIQ